MTLFDFTKDEEIILWKPINDTVMGGISRSSFTKGGVSSAVFSGFLSLENNGGFSSIRSNTVHFQLLNYEGIELRVFGDSKKYKFNIRLHPDIDGVVFQSEFISSNGYWENIRLPFSHFKPFLRGNAVEKYIDFDPEKICSFGLLISGRQEGSFRLEIDYIKAYSKE